MANRTSSEDNELSLRHKIINVLKSDIKSAMKTMLTGTFILKRPASATSATSTRRGIKERGMQRAKIYLILNKGAKFPKKMQILW